MHHLGAYQHSMASLLKTDKKFVQQKEFTNSFNECRGRGGEKREEKRRKGEKERRREGEERGKEKEREREREREERGERGREERGERGEERDGEVRGDGEEREGGEGESHTPHQLAGCPVLSQSMYGLTP